MSLSRACPDDQPADLRDRDDDSPLPWPVIDTSLLDDGRGPVPPFPIDLIPQPWRDWTADRARGASAPVDYAAQALLAAVSGVCGAGVEVKITPEWSEPLVLWQALVGHSQRRSSQRQRGTSVTTEAAASTLTATATAGGHASQAEVTAATIWSTTSATVT